MTVQSEKSVAEEIKIFRRCFSGLKHVYGTYDPQTGRVCQLKEPVTDQVLLAHLSGKQSYGVYLLIGDKTRALAVDFDINDISKPVAFVDTACKYGIPAYVERSKSKGYHVWIFFQEDGVLAHKARLVAKKILADIHAEGIEMFPKQDSLNTKTTYGNFINAPLFGRLVPKARTVFLDMTEFATPYPDQWEFLDNVHRIPEEKLDEIITTCNLTSPDHHNAKTTAKTNISTNNEPSPFGLPLCARRMLAEGVSSYQRVACFRLAVNLKRTGLPYDLALITLKAWAKKNKPADGNRTITESEIESQTECAYRSSYRSLGCEDPAVTTFCDQNCLLYQQRINPESPSKTKP